MLDGEGLGEIGAGCLPGTAARVKVRLAGADFGFLAGLGGDVVLIVVPGEVRVGYAEAGLQQSFLDRAELAD